MIISGVLVLTAPSRMEEVQAAIATLPWAEVHHADESGRMIVIVEAETGEDGMERVKALKRMHAVLAAEPVLHCFEDEATLPTDPRAAVDELNRDDEETPLRSFYSRIKALGNH